MFNITGHQVHHKWAALSPGPEDQQMSDEIRGYLQCDISITGKDSSRPAPEPAKCDEADFEKYVSSSITQLNICTYALITYYI